MAMLAARVKYFEKNVRERPEIVAVCMGIVIFIFNPRTGYHNQ
jgi:hypothetical protein